jgi:hypothetical protein
LGVGAGAIIHYEAELKLRPTADNEANAIVVTSLIVRRKRGRESSEQSA